VSHQGGRVEAAEKRSRRRRGAEEIERRSIQRKIRGRERQG
jgi:hypothetical protein